MKVSGTCNVCAAPCSSCMHFTRAVSLMESKAEHVNSENSCGKQESDNCSFGNSEMPLCFKSKLCVDQMQEASETSKMFSATSSHDSYSENAESKDIAKTPDMHDVSEGIDMPLKLATFERVEENQPLVLDHIKSQSSQEPPGFSEVQRALQQHQGDLHESECHDDNISCVTGLRDGNAASSCPSTSLIGKKMSSFTAYSDAATSKRFKMVDECQAADGNIADIHVIQHQTNKLAQESSQTKNSSYNPTSTGFSLNDRESSPLNGKPSPKEGCAHSNIRNGKSFCTSVDLRDCGEDSISQQPSEGFVVPSEFSLGWEAGTDADECKSLKASSATVHSNNEMIKPSKIKDDASPRGNQCREVEIEGRDVNLRTAVITQEMPSAKLKMPSSNMNLDVQVPQSGLQPTLPDICPDEDTFEDDVKVCDICGDAGREDLLAICSRCCDGAEHTYCMRIMLDKVPGGDWLCEECKSNKDMLSDQMEKSDSGKLKDMPINKMEKIETVSDAPRAGSSMEKFKKVGPGWPLPRLDISAIAVEAPLIIKNLPSSQMSAKRPASSSEVISQSNKKLTDATIALTASPSRKSMLSRESSIKKIDAGKPKHSNFLPPGSQSSTASQVLSRSFTSGINSSRVQGQSLCSQGSLSRSGSFNCPKTKVNQVPKNIPQKSQYTKELGTNDSKEGFGRILSKSASCKDIDLRYTHFVESSTSSQPVVLHQSEAQNVPHNKEKAIERKSSFLSNQILESSSLASAPSVSTLKAEPKMVQNELKTDSMPETNLSHHYKVMEDSHAKAGDLRKQKIHASKAYGNHPLSGAFGFANQNQNHVSMMEDSHVATANDASTVECIITNSCTHDEKFKESSMIGSSRISTLPSKRTLKCLRCNETGHSTQFCSIDKHRVSALKPSADRTQREAANKGYKWKDAVDAIISKGRVQKNTPDLAEEISNTDVGSEIVSQNRPSSSSSCVRWESTVEGIADKPSNFRNSLTITRKISVNDVEQHASQMVGNVCSSRDGETKFLLAREELKDMPSTSLLPDHCPVLVEPLRVSALPDHEYIWQGSFEVKRHGRLLEVSDGFQAHLSTCASSKVLKVVANFPNKIQLEEVARLSSWPLQFRRSGPTEENIALFFFARDVASYKRSYSKVLDDMLQNDLALKGNIDGIELLIFPSSNLPEKCQRWNQLHFLWGVFRERSPNCEHKSSGQSNCMSNNYSENIVNALPMQPVSRDPFSGKESSYESTYKFAPQHEESVKGEVDDLVNLSFLEAEHELFVRKISENVLDSKLLHTRSYQSTETDLLTSKRKQTGSYDVFHLPRVQKGAAQLDLETCQKELITCLDRREEDKLSVFQNKSVQASFVLSSKHDITSDAGPPDLNVDSHDMKKVQSSFTVTEQLGSSPFMEAGAAGSKDEGRTEKGTVPMDKSQDIQYLPGLTDNRQSCSHSLDIIQQVSGEMRTSATAAILWKRTERVSPDEERESKRVKILSDVPDCSSSRIGSSVDEISSNVVNEQLYLDNVQNSLPTLPESSRSSERYFFPLDSTSVMDTKTGSMIPLQILSSDDEYELQPECEPPNLDLALGAEMRPMKQEPLTFQVTGETRKHGKLPCPVMEVGEDETASLSLSLAFPFSGKKQAQVPVSKTEQVLPKKPQVNTSLLLFGSYADT